MLALLKKKMFFFDILNKLFKTVLTRVNNQFTQYLRPLKKVLKA